MQVSLAIHASEIVRLRTSFGQRWRGLRAELSTNSWFGPIHIVAMKERI